MCSRLGPNSGLGCGLSPNSLAAAAGVIIIIQKYCHHHHLMKSENQSQVKNNANLVCNKFATSKPIASHKRQGRSADAGPARGGPNVEPSGVQNWAGGGMEPGWDQQLPLSSESGRVA